MKDELEDLLEALEKLGDAEDWDGTESAEYDDGLTNKDFGELTANDQINNLNERLDFYFQTNNNQTKLSEDHKFVLGDERFQSDIRESRSRLGLEKLLDFTIYKDNPSKTREWLINQLAGGEITEENPQYEQYQDLIIASVDSILIHNNLPSGWFRYVHDYLVLGEPPKHTEIDRQTLIIVDSTDEHSVTVTMEKGLKSKDYIRAWRALKPVFAQPSNYQPTSTSLKNKIFLDRKKGLGISEIAKKYYKEEYKTDPFAARDKVKKTIARFQ